jgi:hypothetical protein
VTAHIHFVSDGAWRHLVKLGQEFGYVAPLDKPSKRSHRNFLLRGHLYRTERHTQGMSTFLTILSTATFGDTRPDYVRERHRMELESRTTPSWRLHRGEFAGRRPPRYVDIFESAADRYVKLAYIFGITGIFRRSAPRVSSKPSTVSAVLEAIGCQLLTPEEGSITYSNELGQRDRRLITDGRSDTLPRVAAISWPTGDAPE